MSPILNGSLYAGGSIALSGLIEEKIILILVRNGANLFEHFINPNSTGVKGLAPSYYPL
jgi:hypothetical protein